MQLAQNMKTSNQGEGNKRKQNNPQTNTINHVLYETELHETEQ